jgi:hypothetical protein
MTRAFNLSRPIAVGILVAILLLSSMPLRADDYNVDLDKSVDYSKLKTFLIRPGRMDSGRQELNNSLVLKKITDAIRASLLSKALKEVAAQPDVIIEYSVSGVDYNIGGGGIARPIVASLGNPGPRGSRGPDVSGEQGRVDFSVGTLVIDVSATAPARLIWRGVYHDTEDNSSKLGIELPKDAKKLLSKYPGAK